MKEQNLASGGLEKVGESNWRSLSAKRIYFGHQSVGFDILNGIRDAVKDHPSIELKIVETTDLNEWKGPLLAHFLVGKNGDPRSKCDHFAEVFEKGGESHVDIAFFKFCFVDVTSGSNVAEIFACYRDTIEGLKKRHPTTTFVHVTVPLTTIQAGIKAWIKKIIGRPIDGYADNMKRDQLNNLIIKEYQGKDAIFDLAKTESTLPDGTRSSFVTGGKTFYSLVPQYTTDGGHLNGRGRRIVAEQLLILLASMSR